MSFITNVYNRLNVIETKRFYYYLIALLSIATLASVGIVFQYYRMTRALKKNIAKVDKYRKEVQEILSRAETVEQQRREVDTLLAQEPDFKIGGEFKKILDSLNMQNAKITTQTVEREDDYIEHSLNAQFVNINMKDLTLLLEKIEANPRIYTNDLDIKRSEKIPGTIDVTLVIATLLPTTTTTA